MLCVLFGKKLLLLLHNELKITFMSSTRKNGLGKNFSNIVNFLHIKTLGNGI